MSELDPRVRALIGRSRAELEPPPGAEQRMLADFHARLGGPPPGDGGDGPPPGGEAAGGAQVVYLAKIVGAVAGLTAAGLVGVWLVGRAVQDDAPAPTRGQSPAAVVAPAKLDPEPASGSPSPVDAAAREELPSSLRTAELTGAEPPTHAPPSERPTSRASEPTTDASLLAAELALIDAARQAPAASRGPLLDRHAQEFPRGELSHEREALRTITACELGRDAEARRTAAAFIALAPGKLLRERVRVACGDRVALPDTEPGTTTDP